MVNRKLYLMVLVLTVACVGSVRAEDEEGARKRYCRKSNLKQTDSLSPNRMISIYRCENIKAAECAEVIENVVGGNGDVVIDKDTNTLLISCSEEQAEIYRNLITELDKSGFRQAGYEQAELLSGASGVEVRVVVLDHVNCEIVAKRVRALFPAEGDVKKATWFEDSNAVLMRATTEELDQMAELIKQIDVPTKKEETVAERPADLVEVVHLTYADGDELGSILTRLFCVKISTSRRGTRGYSLVVFVDERLNALILKGQPEKISEARELISVLDVPAGPRMEAVRGNSHKPAKAKKGRLGKRKKKG